MSISSIRILVQIKVCLPMTELDPCPCIHWTPLETFPPQVFVPITIDITLFSLRKIHPFPHALRQYPDSLGTVLHITRFKRISLPNPSTTLNWIH